jgi:murein hydrolase activator
LKKPQNIILSFLFLICFCINSISYAQKRTVKTKPQDKFALEQQRQTILTEIKETQKKLAELQKDKTASIEQLQALQNKLMAREALINTINKEIGFIAKNIDEASGDVNKLTIELAKLRKNYAELVRYTYKQKSHQNILLFLFNSESFNDALRRYKYIKQYRDYRKAQADKITSTNESLKLKINVLAEQKKEKDMMLQSEEEQRRVLDAETKEKNAVVVNLKGQEAQLSAQIAQKQKVAVALNNAITLAIKREIELARKKAEMERRRLAKLKEEEEKRNREKQRLAVIAKQREAEAEERRRLKEEEERNKKITAIKKSNLKPNANDNTTPSGKPIASNGKVTIPKVEPTIPKDNNKPTAYVKPQQVVRAEPITITSNYANDLSVENRTLSSNFETNKGYLQAPVAGYICSKFGKHKHPSFNVMEENYGVDIRTSKGSMAKSVFGGEVSSVFYIAGAGNNILINHGSYFTLYSKIDKVSVSKGEKIGPRAPLGTVMTDAEGNTQVHFEIWKVGANGALSKMNPEQWIKL